MPTITYVGRITDSRKGLPIFLEALELLLSVDLPPFRVRIVGGASLEAASVEQALRRAVACSKALDAGRIEVWSRIDRLALPELYSRSTVICIPSLREQFGMVAIEAMMCGTPVVASRIGGLQDLILPDLTGYLVDRLNPSALAVALAQFVNNPNLGKWMGRNALLWTTSRFDVGVVARRYVDLFKSLKGDVTFTPDDSCQSQPLLKQIIEADMPAIEQLLGSRVTKYKDLSSSPTPSLVVETKSGSYFVKLHQRRPPCLSSLSGSGREARPLYEPVELIKLAKLLSSAPIVPQFVLADEERGILIQELLLNDAQITDQEAERRMIEASAQLQSFVNLDGHAAERFLEALLHAETAMEEDQAVGVVDKAATELTCSILKVRPTLRQCHPQIELARIASYLRKNSWAISPDFGALAGSLVRFLISERPLVRVLPRLQHGSMKREHLMQRSGGGLALCDLDHVGLYVGPHDMAYWFHDQHANDKVPAPFRMLSQIHRLAQSDDERFLGAVWLAVFPIFNALWRFARGDWTPRLWDMQFLISYPEAFRKVFIQSRESAVGP